MTPLSRPRGPSGEVVVLDAHRDGAPVPDGELVRLARAGDEWACEAIYLRYAPLVAATARRLLKNGDEVDDIVHDTFVVAFERLDQLLVGDALRGWLARIAVSHVHRRFRRLKFMAFLGGEDPTPCLEAQASAEASPEHRAELALIDRALASLPMQVRTAWVLRNVVGLPLDDVATACDCSLATIKRRIADADATVQRHAGGPR